MVDSVLEVQNIKTTGISPQKDIVTTSGTGDVTVNGNIVVPDSGTIGSASATGAITIDSSGNTTLGGNLVIPNSGTIGSVGDTDAITIDASGNTTITGSVTLASCSIDATNAALQASSSCSLRGGTGGTITVNPNGLIWSYFSANANVSTDASGYLTTASDKNKKKNLGKIESGQGLNTITQMQAYRFNYLSDLEAGIDIPTIGFFAQDLYAINTEIGLTQTKEIDGKEEELWGINSMGILAYMVEAIKELSEKVTALEEKVTALEGA